MDEEFDPCLEQCMAECPYKDYYLCLENCEAVCMDEEPVIEGDYEEEWEEEVMSDG